MKKFFGIYVLLLMVLLTSCTTIRYGGKSEILFISDPKVTNISISNARNGQVIFEGKTPNYVTLPKNQSIFLPAKYTIEISLPNAKPLVLELTANGFNTGWYVAGNLLTFGVGWFIDLFTGSMYAWKPIVVVDGKGAVSGAVYLREDNTLQILYQEVDAESINSQETESYF